MSIKKIRTLVSSLALVGLASLLSTHALAKDLRVGIKTEPSSLDPQYHALTPNIQISHTLFDPMVRANPNSQPTPGLAESWTNDGLVWTFKLRPNVKFSDGSPLTAEDVVFTINRVPLVPNSPSSFTTYTQNIEKVEAIDPLTVKITTKVPYPLLLNNMMGLPIMSKAAASGSAPEGVTSTELNSGKGLVGTGPYRFVSWKRGAELVFERNPHYWGEAPEWDKIIYRPITNAASRVAALQAGDVDIVEDPPTDDFAKLSQNDKLNVITAATSRVIYIALDQNGPSTPTITGTDKNPLLDIRVRQALSLALDRKGIVDRDMSGVAQPAAQLLPYPMFGASPNLTEADLVNVEKAKTLLKEAGYPNGFAIKLGAPSGRYINDTRIAQTVASMWSRIGVKTEVDAVAPPVFFKNRDTFVYSAYMAGWAVTSGEMSQTLIPLLGTPNPEAGFGNTNKSRYSNPELDKILIQANSTLDDKERAALLAKASELAMADFAMLPIHFEKSVWAMRKDLTYTGRSDQMSLMQYVRSKP